MRGRSRSSTDTPPPSPPPAGGPVLEARRVGLRYGATDALRDATLSVQRGEVVAVVGPSGSGKSSLLHCMGCVVAPTSGEVYLDGRRIDHADDGALSEVRLHRFGFVFQFGELIPELTMAENVAVPLRFAGRRRDASQREARDGLDALGIGHLADRRPSEVSGGELQRGAIARALVHEPDVVFADEPTGALDSETGDRVLDQLLDARIRRNASIVLVTHDHRIAARADRTVSVADGVLLDPRRDASHGSEPR